jgi:hypothetical protein
MVFMCTKLMELNVSTVTDREQRSSLHRSSLTAKLKGLLGNIFTGKPGAPADANDSNLRDHSFRRFPFNPLRLRMSVGIAASFVVPCDGPPLYL